MQQISFWIIISVFVMGVSSCEQTPDAFKCITIKDADNNLYLRCRNSQTKESINKNMSEIGFCIRNPNEECAWIMTDEREYKTILDSVNQKGEK